MKLPPLSPVAKAYAGALIAFLAALIAQPDFGARSIITAIVGAAAGGVGVYAVPNANYPQRAKPRGGLVTGVLTDTGDLLTPKDEPPPASPPA